MLLLAQIPFDPAVAAAGDNGVPVVANAELQVSQSFIALAELVATEIVPLVEMSGCTTRLLDAAAAALGALPKH